jgi:hypothetical protein
MSTDRSYAFSNWVAALTADAVFFNSTYHHEVFFDEMPRLLRSFPDHTHVHLVDRVREKSSVLPVGVDLSWASAPRASSGSRLSCCGATGGNTTRIPRPSRTESGQLLPTHDFRVALLGERFRTVPRVLDELADELAERIEESGYLPRDEYRTLLLRSDIVVSTARQEFFGISVVEAIAAGARPVLPNRLSYPWLIPNEHHGDVLYEPGRFAAALRAAVDRPVSPNGLRETMSMFDWSVMAPRYDAVLEAL